MNQLEAAQQYENEKKKYLKKHTTKEILYDIAAMLHDLTKHKLEQK